MRRTMFVVPLDLAAVMDAACTRALVPVERRKLVSLLRRGRRDRRPGGMDRSGSATRRSPRCAPADRLPASAMTKVVPESVDTRCGRRSARRTRAPSGCRPGCCSCCRPRGTSLGPVRWGRGSRASTAGRRWTTGSASCPPLGDPRARAELTRRWLRSFGPGTTDDLAWWTKWTRADLKVALADVGAVAVTLDTGDDPRRHRGGRWPTTSTTPTVMVQHL